MPQPQLLQNEGDSDITRILEALACSQPAAAAIHVPGRTTLRYADLGMQIRYVRERLGSWGIARGDIVAAIVPSRPEMAVICATLPGASALAPLSPTLTTPAYCDLLARLRPKALIVPHGVDHAARSAARECGITEIELVSDPCVPAGMFTLKLARPLASLSSHSPLNANVAYILATSGTTGRPKLVPLGHHLMSAAVHVTTMSLQLASEDVGCHGLPMHTASGVRSALIVPLLAGSAIVCLPEGDIDGLFAAIDEYRVTCLSAGVPAYREMLRRAPMVREIVDRSCLRVIRAASSHINAHEIDCIEQTFKAPLFVAYSTTETFVVTQDTPGMRKPHSVGRPAVNEVAVIDHTGAFVQADRTGEIIVRGPLVFDGYLDDPKQTAKAFTNGWYRTGDLGYFDVDGYLFLQGRAQDIINRGGEKISPLEIDAMIETLPGVQAAATFAVPHRSLGEEIVAAVVKHAESQIQPADVVDHVHRHMGPKRMPRQVYFVDQLPRTDLGKVRRSELAGLLGLDRGYINTQRPSEERAFVPTSTLEAALSGLWCSVLQIEGISTTDDFFLLGGDSLSGARLLSGVTAVFGVKIAIETMFGEAATVAGMARTIAAERAARTDGNPG